MVLVLHGRIVAIATAELLEPDSAEVAFLVEDGHHGQGIGSLLVPKHILGGCRARPRNCHVRGQVLLENYAMLAVLTDAGFAYKRHTEDDLVTVHLDTRVTAISSAAADARDRRAEASSLHPMLYPRSVAVRSDGTGIGRQYSIDRIGDTRKAVRHTSQGPGYRRRPGPHLAASATGPFDLAVIAVPAGKVLTALEDAADAGVPARS